ncbi:50S ribosomal protein L15 [Candidatus Woesebacteria bacterium RIFCSPLOWO2_01_FULL_39_61]|uniref:Large ribosomal subunit protein uL15 n=2 Tax=Microgenomates group TaxID=1794810 RepID=A0A0H4TQ91_9BACT|nr:50S ribosomal protein L15 [uncultured Microgenomates bacterium Rifle_16ft_4_minimus_37836]OGM28072.1 MAG: 50S ribosomal protein L15 [Candidatus Woesebacteria bacterium RIFCSPHIGHO2_01_FULL_39_95]OGM34060.1 MAG: 50S ribosomal protein L15 [Candidatus Woesebacteria bacterium RIFCSPHIGHO2_02_FULL_39_13]OGM38318.1 MAG: 50S ribosomal protein L15 [Candidatus Woesebacteria bacterium RIFCSPHIGHO2_12_FULL_40_20]OGM67781.1 MAG: 50S ribosomal protein L15 [Candidatus Woesebacteria bacterium RIFCSPLOWO2_0
MKEKLKKVVTGRRKRLGRGYGSGKGGHTVGRGQKGQKSRRAMGILFEGVKMKKSFVKRLPLRRGKGRFKAKNKPIIVKLGYLNLIPNGSKVTLETLIKMNIVDKNDANKFGVKILGDGDINKKLIIELPISNSSAKKIEKAGGKVVRN